MLGSFRGTARHCSARHCSAAPHGYVAVSAPSGPSLASHGSEQTMRLGPLPGTVRHGTSPLGTALLVTVCSAYFKYFAALHGAAWHGYFVDCARPILAARSRVLVVTCLGVWFCAGARRVSVLVARDCGISLPAHLRCWDSACVVAPRRLGWCFLVRRAGVWGSASGGHSHMPRSGLQWAMSCAGSR